MDKKGRGKCCDCGKRRKLKRIKLFKSYEDAEKNKNGFYDYFCQECECQIPEA